MTALTHESLKKYRDALLARPNTARGRIAISLGTCGIAAGGDKVLEEFQKAFAEKHITSIELKQTGCLGMCFCEPNMFVSVEGMPDVLYGYVTPEIAERIVDEHIVKRTLVNEYVIFMPIKDAVKLSAGEGK
jgi:NADP-reducing hydrogenase subunit HndB